MTAQKSVITFHYLGPFPNKTLKKRTHSTFNHFDLRGVKLFRCGRCTNTGEIEFFRPPLLPLLQLPTGLARSKNGWAKHSKAESGVRKKQKWRPVGGQQKTWPSLESRRVGLKYMILMYRTSYFKRMAYLLVSKRMATAWKVWRALACYKGTVIHILVGKWSLILIRQSICS